MWLFFCLTVLLCAAFCMVPGYLLARLLGLPRRWAAVASPVIGIAEIGTLGEAYVLAGVHSNPATIMLPLVAIPLVLLLVFRCKRREIELPQLSLPIMVASVLVGAVAGYFLFVSHLYTYWSVYQSPDTPFHLNEIRAFANSGRFTLLNVDAYLGDDSAINPISGAGFYPTGWHSLCALVVQTTGRPVAFAINASMWFFTGAVYPLSALAFVTYLFPDNRRVQLAAVFAAPAFVLFPWTLLLFGPEYPNLAGFATLPVTLILFMHLFGFGAARSERARVAFLFVVATTGQALLHPNTLFSAVVLLVPFCVDHIWSAGRQRRGLAVTRSLIWVTLFLVAVGVVWVGLYLAPPLRSTVSFEWRSFAEPYQEIFNILTLSYEFMLSYEYAPQYVLGTLVIMGFVRCLYDDEHRWHAISYLLAVVILVIDASYAPTSVRRLFAGFWYSDPIRISAMCVIAAAPISAYGMDWVYSISVRLVRRYNGRARVTHPMAIATVLIALFLLTNYAPNLYIPGSHVNYDHALENQDAAGSTATVAALRSLEGEPDFRSTFGNYSEYIDRQYGTTSPLTLEEFTFLDQVADFVDPGDVIINNPMDGSFMAYGSNDLRIYYRVIYGYGDRETSESWAIRERLCNLTTDPEVQDAVAKISAKYVLILSEEGSSTSLINDKQLYLPLGFSGISSIQDDTPGFEVVLSSGSLRLYRIVG